VRRVDLAPGSEQAHELWALPAEKGGAPKSLGLIPAGDKGNIRLVAAADQSLRNVPALAISLEPTGGSKTGLPTGPVLASGPCIKFW
jgi:anti-sigma-K factor RskA